MRNGWGHSFCNRRFPFSLTKIANSSIFDGLSRHGRTLSGTRDYRGQDRGM